MVLRRKPILCLLAALPAPIVARAGRYGATHCAATHCAATHCAAP